MCALYKLNLKKKIPYYRHCLQSKSACVNKQIFYSIGWIKVDMHVLKSLEKQTEISYHGGARN